MKRNHLLRALISALLILCMVFGLCACPGSGPTPNPDPDPDPDPTPDPTPDPEPEDVVFGDGGTVAGAGETLADDSFAKTAHTAGTEVIDITAAAFINLFRATGPEAGKTYRVTEGVPTFNGTSGRQYSGNGAILLSAGGMVISGASEFALSDLTVITEDADGIQLTDSRNITLSKLDIQAAGKTALSVPAGNSSVKIQDCRLSGATALSLGEDDASVKNSVFLFTACGIRDTAQTGTTVLNCSFTGTGTGIVSGASESAFRKNTLTLTEKDTGICIEGTGKNALVAQNIVKGAQDSIVVKGMTNTAVILNSAVSLRAENGHSLYFCDNALGGIVRAKDNQYILADGNTYPEDGKSHASVQSGNENQSGDALTDVTLRAENGVNEDLLPKVDRDLFVGMERKTAVKDPIDDTAMPLNTYLVQHAKNEDVVIVAPGAYTVTSTMQFNETHSGTTIYAYGVYCERDKRLDTQINVAGTQGLAFKGMTLAYAEQSCGQVYVLEKMVGNQVRVVTGAGLDNEFGVTLLSRYNAYDMGAQRQGTYYAYCDTGFNAIRKDNATGTMIMNLSAAVYNMLETGDILTCRAVDGGTSVSIGWSSDISFTDFTLYGTAAGFAYVENENQSTTTYYRVLDTTQSGRLIDQATYERYEELEEQYGVSLEIYTDELGRYRGSPMHIGSIDATHTSRCAQGSTCISCLFENMCDDGTNQNASHARLASLTDNGDGTTTITYKGNWSDFIHSVGGSSHGTCADFDKDNRVYIYTSAGQLVCDTPALTASRKTGTGLNQSASMIETAGKPVSYDIYTITVATEAVNFAAIEGFDLSDDDYIAKNKVLVDNMSKTSNGFIFDNCLVQNIRSRALLIKASDGKIIHCTFRNIGMSCAAILYEIYWGESGITENLLIANNLFDHTGYFRNQDLYAPISVYGLGSKVDDDYLLYNNIQIIDNVMRNRTTDYAVYINSAKDITISGNDFGTVIGEDEDHPSAAIHINGAKDVNIFDNIYSPFMLDICDAVKAEHNIHVYGKDVEDGGESLIPDHE